MRFDRRALSANLFGLIDRFDLDAERLAEAAGMDYADLHSLLCMRRDASQVEIDQLAKALGVEPWVLLAP